MKTFLVTETQLYEGCDHSIGCGERMWEIEAESVEAILDRLAKLASADSDVEDELLDAILDTQEGTRASITIREVGTAHPLDLEAFRTMDANVRAGIVSKDEEEAERKELERLKAKFE